MGVEDDVDQCPDLGGSRKPQGCPESDLDKENTPNVLDTCAKERAPRTTGGALLMKCRAWS